ncbi:hypothetical protein [Magnetospirillum aberrantis]|uniref:Uncharacterized protein n=1 Tax=Magnetospirillum aberrantis SpK TaxID=908842 RepID=A0A7C9QTB5_9PROT|nr:hypothetical protein [Magnetospirillum aberrantis]NFV80045.1 hypothetical protein [Magnetospirillum aberrantis SpK]
MNWTAFFAAGMLIYGVYALGLFGMLLEREGKARRPDMLALILVGTLSLPALAVGLLVGWLE